MSETIDSIYSSSNVVVKILHEALGEIRENLSSHKCEQNVALWGSHNALFRRPLVTSPACPVQKQWVEINFCFHETFELLIKFIYSEKATKFCEISTFVLCSASQK